MARQPEMTTLRSFQMLFDVGTIGGLTDGQLLEQFRTRRDELSELAFATLVERHGLMVLRVCRSVLRDDHDSQDAFQATFLILAQAISPISVHDSLGPWLHRVAWRTALRAKHTSARRRAAESRAAEMMVRSAIDPEPDDLEVLYAEIDRLPERYRKPIVLCDVESRTYEEAAQHLGWPLGTVKSRIARGRARLEVVLRRRGFGVLIGPFPSHVFVKGSCVIPSALLVHDTARVAKQLAAGACTGAFSLPVGVKSLYEGVLMTMFLTKVKSIALVVLALGISTLVTSVVARQPQLQEAATKGGRALETSDQKAEPVPKSVEMPAKQDPASGGSVPEAKRDEPKISKEDITPITKEQLVTKVPNFFMFDYPFEPQPGKRVWLRVDDKHFAERYPDGTENRFLIIGHAKVRGIEGTIVSRVAGDPETIRPSEERAYQTFIPDKGNEEMAIFNRWLPSEWRDMSWSLKMPTIIRRVE